MSMYLRPRLNSGVWLASIASASLLLSACAEEERTVSAEGTAIAASAITASATASKVIPGRYIVVFKSDSVDKTVAGRTAADVARTLETQYAGKLVHTYQYALQGMAIDISEQEVERLRADPRVAYIEPDQVGSIVATQANATWGLDRIDQRFLPLNQTYTYPDQAGAGAHAYVLDTGIYAAHPEFEGRVIPGVDFEDNDADPDDCHGHGTHVAGTIASATYGVAKKATLHSIRVCDCYGSCDVSQVIAGIDYVTNNHISPAVANMSLRWFSVIQAMNDAVTNSIASGVTYAVAAGNENLDACQMSPASTPNALTVGATQSTDRRGTHPGTSIFFSNFGPCVDLFAPGRDITSTWIQPALTNTIYGTSMATPHVAGAAALYLGLHPTATPAQVSAALLSQATPNVVTDPGVGSPNLLLYTGFMNTQPSTPCSGLCSNPTQISINGSYQSGPIGTGATCFQTTSVVHGGNCGNFVSPRTLRVNGVTETCNNLNWPTIPAARNGGYCIQTTAGNHPWAFFTLW